MPETSSNPDATPATVLGEDGLRRPVWASSEPLMRDYYDAEWGVPVTDEQGMFERVCLEGFQAGLSWRTVLVKREALRENFLDFNPDVLVEFTESDIERIAQDPRIIRSRPKIRSVLKNARATLTLRERATILREKSAQAGSSSISPDDARLLGFILPNGMRVDDGLPALIWSFRPEVTPLPTDFSQIPTQSEESLTLAKRLKREGFSFVGPTTVYAMFEACGVVDTHLLDSHRRGVSKLWKDNGTRLG